MYMFTYFSKKLTFKNPYVILFQRVYILPLRNENWSFWLFPMLLAHFVYILPLRNENFWHDMILIIKYISLYPTFKEWKQQWKQRRWKKWLSLYPTFKEWKRECRLGLHTNHFVYILPLRNENFFILIKREIFLFVYILPLRNENPNCKHQIIARKNPFISYL